MQRLLNEVLTPSSNCVDVGAHHGEFLRYFTDRAPGGRHVAIEALPHLATKLRNSFPDAVVVETAVADRPGTATFFHAIDRPGWSGLKKQEYPDDTTVEEITVKVSTLDQIVPVRADVDFVKIDVEGAELGVILGMRRLLAENSPTLLFEHALIHAKAHATGPGQIYDAVAECGYAVYGLDGRGPYDRQRFIALCESADRSSYGRDAQTNWVARPAKPGA